MLSLTAGLGEAAATAAAFMAAGDSVVFTAGVSGTFTAVVGFLVRVSVSMATGDWDYPYYYPYPYYDYDAYYGNRYYGNPYYGNGYAR
jgi:hypothetical protein